MENKKSSSGKGDSPRNCFSRDFKNNMSEIRDFGKQRRLINKYPEQLSKLVWATHEKKSPWDINDETKFAELRPDFVKSKRLKQLCEKYKLDKSIEKLYVWEIIEQMYNYLPF